jgi:hypothetical protein
VNSTKISFFLSFDDVTLKISKKSRKLPRISSVIVRGEEFCERKSCGVRSEAVPVIIGGNRVREGAWPWHAALYYRPSVDVLRFRCGSTILNKKTVITIATCLVTFDPGVQERVAIAAVKLSVGVGETVLYDSSAAHHQMIPIDEIKLHEMFKRVQAEDGDVHRDDFNVALLLLRDDIRFSLHVQPICLPAYTVDDEFDYDERRGKVVGW